MAAFLLPCKGARYVFFGRKDVVMNDIQIFKNEAFGEVRVAGTSDEPLFCLADICKVVELTNPSSIKSRLEKEDVQMIDLHALNPDMEIVGNSMATFVNESGLYDTLLLSSSNKVRPYKRWIIHDVLPSIRKHGIYATDNVIDQILNNPDFGIELLTKLKEERSARIEAEKQVTILTHVNKTYTCTEVAKELGLKSAIELNKRLKDLGVQYKVNQTWVPYTKYATLGWFDIKQEVTDNGHIIYHRRITGIGRQGIINLVNPCLL